MVKKIDEKVDFFIHNSENRDFREKFFNDCCSEKLILSGFMGNKIGLEEIKAIYKFRDEVFSLIKTTTDKRTSYKNVIHYEWKATFLHNGNLTDSTKEKVLKSNNCELVKLLITIPSTGKTIEVNAGITFVIEYDKVTFLNINADSLEITKQLFPLLNDQTFPYSTFKVNDFIQSIKERFAEKISPMEIQCLAFSLCGFSAKQSSFYLHLSHRTVESYIQNAYCKLNCSSKGECLESMYKSSLIVLFQQLCQYLISIPNSTVRS